MRNAWKCVHVGPWYPQRDSECSPHDPAARTCLTSARTATRIHAAVQHDARCPRASTQRLCNSWNPTGGHAKGVASTPSASWSIVKRALSLTCIKTRCPEIAYSECNYHGGQKLCGKEDLHHWNSHAMELIENLFRHFVQKALICNYGMLRKYVWIELMKETFNNLVLNILKNGHVVLRV